MKILIIDTATEACSVALGVDDLVYHRFEVCPQQHSQRVLPMLDEVLQEANLSLNELDYLGFGRGPGSFTGVRIATGVLQGLALGTGLKVVEISTLAAMAQQAAAQYQVKQVACAIDARMSEVYFARYEDHQGQIQLVDQEQVLPPQEAASLLVDGLDYYGVGTGWQAYAELNPDTRVQVLTELLYPDALHMLPLAKALIAAGQAIEGDEIRPVYLRDKVTWKKLPGRE
jgi:tRNA threonylcarbamoyladenosine biosynthesis protein TsaB